MAHMPRLSMSNNLPEGAAGGGGAGPNGEITPLSPPMRANSTLGVPNSPSPTHASPGGRKMSMRDAVRGSISANITGDGGGGGGHKPRSASISMGGSHAIQNLHSHHYHYHLYQTTVTESSGDDKDKDKDDEHDEQEEQEMAELMEMFPDGIPEELLADDGSGVPQEIVDEQGNVITVIRPRQKAMKNIFGQHDLSPKDIESLTFMAKVYRFLHEPSSGWVARLWSILMVVAIITSSVMILMQSMPSLKLLDTIKSITYNVELYSVSLFTFDYLAKLIAVHSYADCVLPKDPGFNVTLRFFIQPLNVLDAASVVPFWVQLVLGEDATSGSTVALIFRIVRTLRILRLLKVAQYSRSIDVFFRVIIQAWDALLLLLFFVGFGCIVFGTLIFMCEQGTETVFYDAATGRNVTKYMRPNIMDSADEESPFTSIPQSFWFVITTLTTVGYGDMVPTSFLGRIVGGTTQLSGVLFISTPLVIFGTHFQNEFTKELERVAFVHRRQEKLKRRQKEKEAEMARRAKEEADARVAAGGTRYGFDDTDPMAAAMGLGSLDSSPQQTNLPGQVPPSPSMRGMGDNSDMFSTPNGRTSTFRNSMLNRGSTMVGPAGRTGSIMIGGGASDVSIRVNDSPGGRGSIMPGGNNFLQSMTAGPSTADSNCTCPCTCGARNAALYNMPGANNVVGGVRRSVITKSGSRMSVMNGGPFLSNPTAADNQAAQKGMQLAASVLPPREVAERSAQSMASQAMTTQSANLSAGNILELQSQMDNLRTLVAQLGGLLIAGGAPAPAIANAMMASVVPQATTASSIVRKHSVTQRVRSGSVAEEVTSPMHTSGMPPTTPGMQGRASIVSPQPASGKFGRASTIGGVPGSSPSPVRAGGGAAVGSPMRTSTKAGSPSMRPGAGAAPASSPNFTLPPAATNASVIPTGGATAGAVTGTTTGATPGATTVAGIEMSALSSPSAVSVARRPSGLMSPVSTAGVGLAVTVPPTPSPPAEEQPAASPPSLPAAASLSSSAPVLLASPSLISGEASVSSGSAAQSGPRPTSLDQIVPAQPQHTFPPAPPDESVIECTQRMLGSMIDTPVLTEKLLSKPPFRFLHDIVTSMMRTRQWPLGYFDARESEASNLTELVPKLDFLEKLIDLLSIVNASDLSYINPKKIVAGLEPDNTNALLQEFARAAATGITVEQITQMMQAAEEAEAGGAPSGAASGLGGAPASSASGSPAPDAQEQQTEGAPLLSSPPSDA